MIQIEDEKEYIDGLIRIGKHRLVHRIILRHSQTEISDDFRLWLSEAARRCSAYSLGLKLLKPFTFEKLGGLKSLTDPQKLSYANLLSRIGAPRRALALLEEISDPSMLEVYSSRAFAYIYLWEYEKALPQLSHYLAVANAGSYYYAVVQINLLASYSFTLQEEKLVDLFRKIQPELIKNNWDLLYFNALEIMTGYYTETNQFVDAKCYLSLAKKYSKLGTRYQLFLHKWDILLSGQYHLVSSVRKQAVNLNLWNTVRDIDSIEAHLKRDSELLSKVYFGSPYPEYQSKILAKNNWYKPPLEYVHKYGNGSSRRVFDLSAACETDREDIALRPGEQSHRFMCSLNSDLYKQSTITEIFCFLAPDQYFDPDTSPRRVYVAAQRLRKWIKQNRLPLSIFLSQNSSYMSISEENLSYSMKINGEDMSLKSQVSLIISALKSRSAKTVLTYEEIESLLQLNRSSVTKLLQKAEDSNLITRNKNGRNVLVYLKD